MKIRGTEPGVTHNRRVSDALHHHRMFDTMTMSPDSRTNEKPSPGRSQQAATLLCLFSTQYTQKTPFGRRVEPRCDRAGVC
ncbi:MAG: hypothetical protein PUJ63_06365 [Bacteroidales bacterium]|nr:hypothetical protein [Bacteroidales bacterium]